MIQPKMEGNIYDVKLTPSILAIKQTAPDHSRFCECFCTLFRWKASIYQLAGKQMLVFLSLYYTLSAIRELILDSDGKEVFDEIAVYSSRFYSSLNLVILLGFFTRMAMLRQFSIESSMPGTAKIINFYINALKPNLPEGSIIVEQFARWTVLAWILTFRIVSKPFRDLYPDMASLEKAGFINANERTHLENVGTDYDQTPRPLLVIEWLMLLTKETATHERFDEVKSHALLVENILLFKKSCGNVIKFSKQNIPHSCIQASIIVLYAFGFLTLMSRALMENEKDESTEALIQLFPFVPALEFFVFLSVVDFGRTAVNPFGSDRSDIDLKSLLKNHVQDSYRLVELYGKHLDNHCNDPLLSQVYFSNEDPKVRS